MLAPLLSLLLVAPAAVGVVAAVEVAGEVQDVVDGLVGTPPVATAVVSSTDGRRRLLTFVDVASKQARPGPAVADNAVAYAVCGGAVVFVDDRGLVDVDGHRVIARTPLLPVADPAALFAAEICPGPPDERVLAVKDGLVVVRLQDGAVVDERVLPFSARARAYSGRGPRSLRGERPYALALSLYVPRLFAVDVDGDADLDLLALHEGQLAIFRRTPAGLSTTAELRDLFTLLGVQGDADLRVRFAGARAFVSVSRGAVPEQSRVVVIAGTVAKPFSQVASSRTIDGLAVLLGVAGRAPVVGRLDTTLVALSGVVLTGRVAVKVSVDDDEVLSLAAAADVRAGKMEGALPVVDVDVDGDGVVDLFDLGEPGQAVLYRGLRGRADDTDADLAGGRVTFREANRWTVPRFTLVVPLPSSSSVALVSAASTSSGQGSGGRKSTSRLTLLGR